MNLTSMIELAKEYFLLGILMVALMLCIFCIGYFLIYKKCFHGQKQVAVKTVILSGIFLCYLVIVLSATLLDRSPFMQNHCFLPFFYSYSEAWNSFSAVAWRNLILNIILFIPFGLLLPLCFKCFQSFWSTYLAGFFTTFLIEGLQFLLKRGVCELDDILNNFFGVMIGYGLFAILRFIKNKKQLAKTCLLQLPLLVTIIFFSVVFISYKTKELGNLSSHYVKPLNPKLLEISSTQSYDATSKEAMVYHSPVLSKEDTKAQATAFFNLLGTTLDDSQTDVYDETIIYYSTSRNHSLWIDYVGGTYSYTDFETSFSEELSPKTNASEEELRKLLEDYGIFVPKEAVFENTGEGRYSFTAQKCKSENGMYDGTLSVTLYSNGMPGEIDNHMTPYEEYKAFPIVSETDAYAWIQEGRFKAYDNDFLNIVCDEVTLDYQLDSKGFYQPVYKFDASINDVDSEIFIPAIQ